MKKILLFILITLVGSFSFAQKANISITTDTVQGAETIYFNPSYRVANYSGLVGFNFTKTDVADSCSTIFLQGAYNSSFTGAVTLSGTNLALTETTTDGSFLLYDATPEYSYYRLGATCAAGDTVIFTNVRFIYKTD